MRRRSPVAFQRSDEIPAVPEQAADSLLALNCLAEPRLRDIGAAMADRLNWFQDRQPTLPGLSSLLRREAASVPGLPRSGGRRRVIRRRRPVALAARVVPGPAIPPPAGSNTRATCD